MTHTEYVVGFCFSSDNERVVLIRKNKPEWQAGKLNGVGGKVEPGELPIDAMVREFREETGAITTPEDWRYFARLHGDYFTLSCYSCFDDAVLENTRTIEEERVVVYPINQLPFLATVSNLLWLIHICLDSDFERIFIDADYR